MYQQRYLHPSLPPRKARRWRRHVVLFLCAACLVAAFANISATHPIVKAKSASKPSAFELNELKILDTEVPTKGLNPVQQQMYTITKQEFATHATSYDATVMKYTQGVQESWCADFVSWIRQAAGVPYVSPSTGYWRIPGVGTLQAYYQTYGDYYDVGAYTPKLGDVAFYNDTTLSGDNTTHVALVLGVVGNNLITIGGNEGDGAGTIQVRSDPLQAGYLGLSGFGDSNLSSN